ncbi:hypothetical protein glysoja_018221 [Glycine soja]|nr:hypothetical protein glysoja_018221 [Glycine soja]
MATKPLTTEAIALTEKKMDMTLDDIIKMSKNTKNKKPRRVLNKSQKFSNNFTQDKSAKVQRYMESRSSLRQGALAKRRSNFQGNQFPAAVEVARKAVTAPLHNRVPNRNRVANWNKTSIPCAWVLILADLSICYKTSPNLESLLHGFGIEEDLCDWQSSKSMGSSCGSGKNRGGMVITLSIFVLSSFSPLQRFRVPVDQRRAANGGFAAKQQPLPSPQKQQENVDIVPKQKPQTLDSLFANMKEQRMRVLSMQNNAVQRNGGGNKRLPWRRGRFGN